MKAEEIQSLVAECEMLREQVSTMHRFKNYVHSKLDEMGVPSDPAPLDTLRTGCRIEGRLLYIFAQLNKLTETMTAIASLYGYRPEDLLHQLTELTEIRESMPDWVERDRPTLQLHRRHTDS